MTADNTFTPSAKVSDSEASVPSTNASDSKDRAVSSVKSSGNEMPASNTSTDSSISEIQTKVTATLDYNHTNNLLSLPVFENIITENPELENGIEEINHEMNEYIETLREKYNWYVQCKYMGHAALDTTYSILCNNDNMLSIRFDSTLNAGGSGTFSRCFTLDKHTGSVYCTIVKCIFSYQGHISRNCNLFQGTTR